MNNHDRIGQEDENEKNKTKMKKNKTNKAKEIKRKVNVALASSILTLIIATTMSGVAAGVCAVEANVKQQKITKLAQQNGYDAANAVYIQVEIGKLDKELDEQIISPSDYIQAIKTIKDLDYNTFMEKAVIQPEVKEEYMNLKKDENALDLASRYALTTTVTCGVLSLSLGGIYGLNTRQKQDNVQNEIVENNEKQA